MNGELRTAPETVAPVRYGLLDTKDNVWIGDDDGPTVIDDERLARLAAEVRSHSLGWAPTRIRAVPYEAPATLKLRDEVTVVVEPLVVLDWLEKGPTTLTVPRRLWIDPNAAPPRGPLTP